MPLLKENKNLINQKSLANLNQEERRRLYSSLLRQKKQVINLFQKYNLKEPQITLKDFDINLERGIIKIKDERLKEFKRRLINKQKEDFAKQASNFIGIPISKEDVVIRDNKLFLKEGLEAKLLNNKNFKSSYKTPQEIVKELNGKVREDGTKLKAWIEGDYVVVEEHYPNGWINRNYLRMENVEGHRIVPYYSSAYDVMNDIKKRIEQTGDLNLLFDYKEAYEYARQLRTESRRRVKNKNAKYSEYEIWFDWNDKDLWDNVDKWDEIREYKEIGNISEEWAKKIAETKDLFKLDKIVKQAKSQLITNALSRARFQGILDYSWKDNIRKLQQIDNLIPDEKLIKIRLLQGKENQLNINLNYLNDLKKELVKDFINDAAAAYNRADKEKAKQMQKRVKELLNKANNSDNFADYISNLKRAMRINNKLAQIDKSLAYSNNDINMIANANLISKINKFNQVDDISKKLSLLQEIEGMPQSKLVLNNNIEDIRRRLITTQSLSSLDYEQEYNKVVSDSIKQKFGDLRVDKGGNIIFEKTITLSNNETNHNLFKEPTSQRNLEPSLVGLNLENYKVKDLKTTKEFIGENLLLMNSPQQKTSQIVFNSKIEEKLLNKEREIEKKILDTFGKVKPSFVKDQILFNIGVGYGFTTAAVNSVVGLALDIKDTLSNKGVMPRTIQFFDDLITLKYPKEVVSNLKKGDAFTQGKTIGELGFMFIPTKPFTKPVSTTIKYTTGPFKELKKIVVDNKLPDYLKVETKILDKGLIKSKKIYSFDDNKLTLKYEQKKKVDVIYQTRTGTPLLKIENIEMPLNMEKEYSLKNLKTKTILKDSKGISNKMIEGNLQIKETITTPLSIIENLQEMELKGVVELHPHPKKMKAERYIYVLKRGEEDIYTIKGKGIYKDGKFWEVQNIYTPFHELDTLFGLEISGVTKKGRRIITNLGPNERLRYIYEEPFTKLNEIFIKENKKVGFKKKAPLNSLKEETKFVSERPVIITNLKKPLQKSKKIENLDTIKDLKVNEKTKTDTLLRIAEGDILINTKKELGKTPTMKNEIKGRRFTNKNIKKNKNKLLNNLLPKPILEPRFLTNTERLFDSFYKMEGHEDELIQKTKTTLKTRIKSIEELKLKRTTSEKIGNKQQNKNLLLNENLVLNNINGKNPFFKEILLPKPEMFKRKVRSKEGDRKLKENKKRKVRYNKYKEFIAYNPLLKTRVKKKKSLRNKNRKQ